MINRIIAALLSVTLACFLVGCDQAPLEPSSIVSPTAGTPIGNMTGLGGLASSFDGNLHKNLDRCSAPVGGIQRPALAGYNNRIGMDWGKGNKKLITGFKLHHATDMYFMQTAAINLKLEASDDGVVWQNLYVGAGLASGGAPSLVVTGGIKRAVAYRFHRINIQGNGLNALVICQVTFAELLQK